MIRDTFDQFQPPERGRFGDEERPDERPRPKGRVGRGPLHERRNVVTLDLYHHQTTAGAQLLSLTGDRRAAKFIPKSLISKFDFTSHSRETAHGVARPCRITLPEWKAMQEGLI